VHEVVLELQQWLPALDKRRKMEKTGC